jgi:uncharacterized protein YjgD (DUF1641 family)
MAQPISFEVPARDPRKELSAKIENAPVEHAEALLDAYQLLQQLHDRHLFEILRGALSASSKLVETAVQAAESPSSMRALRNALILGRTLGSINPDLLACFAVAVRETLGGDGKQSAAEPPGLLTLMSQLRQTELRRTLGLIMRFLDVLGKEMKQQGETPPAQ